MVKLLHQRLVWADQMSAGRLRSCRRWSVHLLLNAALQFGLTSGFDGGPVRPCDSAEGRAERQASDKQLSNLSHDEVVKLILSGWFKVTSKRSASTTRPELGVERGAHGAAQRAKRAETRGVDRMTGVLLALAR